MNTSKPVQPYDVVVIGAGHNGLVAGCYAARAGLDVLVVEAAPHIGGMTVTQPVVDQAPDHVFNLCAVDLIFMRLSTIIADLDLARFGYRDVEADPGYAYLDPEGASIALWHDPRRTAEEIARFSHADAQSFLHLSRVFSAAMTVAKPMMLTNPVRPAPRAVAASAGLAVRNGRYLPELATILRRSAKHVIEDRFEHPIVRTALDMLASTAAPITRPGSSAGLMYLGFNNHCGAARPIGGIGALPAALEKCLQSYGGEVRTCAAVDGLITAGARIAGVHLANGEEILARAVISTVDPVQTLTDLVPTELLSQRARGRVAKIPTGNDGAVFMKVDIACDARIELTRHTKWRSDDLDLRIPFSRMGGSLQTTATAQSQSANGIIPDEVPFGASVPTAVDPSQAPPGQDTIYLYAWGLPKDPPHSWSDAKAGVAERLVKELGTYYTNLSDIEIGRFVESCQDMAHRTGATNGNEYHVDIKLSRMGPLRPAAGFAGYRTRLPGLFLSGAGTHPGPGVSGVPGQLAAREVIKSLRSSP